MVINFGTTIRMGNEPVLGQPFEAEVKAWISDELQEILLEKVTGPNEEKTVRLFNIKRVEPDPELFKVPNGFAEVTD